MDNMVNDALDSEELSPRAQAVLRLVITEYVKTATPVGSKRISDGYELGVSPATIRQEMSALEAGGYLTHPHTSAGRMPTEKGYRYFVRELMGESSLPLPEQRTINHQFHQTRLDLEQWMRLAAAVLAHNARGASLVTMPKSTYYRIKHVELVAIHDVVVLLILVLQAGIVKQQVITLDVPAGQDELSRTARRLTDLWKQRHYGEIRATLNDLNDLETAVAKVVLATLQRVEGYSSTDIYRDGLLNVLCQPEFARSDGAQQIVRVLEERQLVETLISDVMQEGGLKVIIGGEGRWPGISDISLVLARYGIDDHATGALGVVGPVRMQYERAVSVVRYVSQLMTELMTELYTLQ